MYNMEQPFCMLTIYACSLIVSYTAFQANKLVLRDTEHNTVHMLNVYFHDREDHRIKYSFMVDDKTTAKMITESMIHKLHLHKHKYTYKLVNSVPAGEGEL